MATQSTHGQTPATKPARSSQDNSAQAETKGFERPDEVRVFPKGKLELVNIGSIQVGRATFQSGWRWTECMRSLAGTDLCESRHMAYCMSGVMHVRTREGVEMDVHAGEAFVLSPGHDAWVIGSEPCVVVDFTGFREYAKPS
jgi:hypothetical protein